MQHINGNSTPVWCCLDPNKPLLKFAFHVHYFPLEVFTLVGLSVCSAVLALTLRPPPLKKIKGPVHHVLKQVVNLSCFISQGEEKYCICKNDSD